MGTRGVVGAAHNKVQVVLYCKSGVDPGEGHPSTVNVNITYSHNKTAVCDCIIREYQFM